MLNDLLKSLSGLMGAMINKAQSYNIADEAIALYNEKKYEAALPLMKEAAEKGNPNAMSFLAIMLMQGRGSECDWKVAAKLYEMTLEMKEWEGFDRTVPTHYGNLGMMYGIGGYGLKRDLVKAQCYLQKAVETGDPDYGLPLQQVIKRTGLFGQKEIARPKINW